VMVAQHPAPGSAPSRDVPAVDRARQDLGLRPCIGLDEATGRTLPLS